MKSSSNNKTIEAAHQQNNSIHQPKTEHHETTIHPHFRNSFILS